MWVSAPDGTPTLSINIARSSPRHFCMNLHHSERGFIVSNEQMTLPESTHQNLQAALQKLTNPNFSADHKAFVDLGWTLFRLVFPERIQAELSSYSGRIVLITEEMSLPWELLHTGERFICLDQPFSRQVIEQQVVGNLLGQPKLSEDSLSSKINVLLIANPTGDLPASEEEALALQALFEQHGFHVRSLIGPDQCDYLSMMGAFKHPCDIIHYSGHTQSVRIEDTWTSMIPLPGGQRLLAEDIRRCLTGKPVVFLNSCHSSDIQATSSANDKQSFGAASIVRTLAQAFTVGNSTGQAQAIIGSMWWINDAVAIEMATDFYAALLQGATLGESLRISRSKAAGSQLDPALWSSYVLFSNRDLKLSFNNQDAEADPPDSGESCTVSEPTASLDLDTQEVDKPTESSPEEKHDLSADDDLPWSEEIHAALLGAVAAVTATNWNIFTSFHLLLGLTYLQDGILRSNLQAQKIDPDVFRRGLRELLRQHKQDAPTGEMEISPNVKQIFSRSKELARENESNTVQEVHLIQAMLTQENSAAQIILKQLGIESDGITDAASPSPIEQHQPEGEKLSAVTRSAPGDLNNPESTDPPSQQLELFDRAGSINLTLFDEDLQAALHESAIRAFQTSWADIRSPHLFLGMALRHNSRFQIHLTQKQNASCQKLAQLILQSLAQTPVAAHRIPKLHREFLSENAIGAIRRAFDANKSTRSGSMTERELLKAILDDEQNIVTRILRQLEIEPTELLWPKRLSVAALAVITTQKDGEQCWLAQWNSRSEMYHFIGGRQEQGETPQACLIREVEEELGIQSGTHYTLITPAIGLMRYAAMSESANQETDYQIYLFQIECPSKTIDLITRNEENAWLTRDEILNGQTRTGKRVSANMGRVISWMESQA